MGFLSNMFNPKNIKYNLPPGVGMLYGGTQGGGDAKPQATGTPLYNKDGYSSGDFYNQYPAGTDPNRNKESGLAYGLPWQLRSTYGAYPGVGGENGLMALLSNPGQTDSAMFNRSLSANSRGTQNTMDAARGNAARSGFGSSGLSAALQAAIGQAGTNQAGGLYAEEARRKEDLRRQDLELMKRFFVDPKLAMYGAQKGVSIAGDQAKQQKQGAYAGGAAALAGGLIAAFACRTAEELYGVDAEDTKYARYYMGKMAEPETREAYGTGAELAARVKADPELRAKVKPIFDGFVAEARRHLAA